MRVATLLLAWLLTLQCQRTAYASQLLGTTDAVYRLITRVLKQNEHPFQLHLVGSSSASSAADESSFRMEPKYFELQDEGNGNILVTGSTASELGAGVGWYLRHYCNMTLGWPSGGGSRIVIPDQWPSIGSKKVRKTRAVPWSYFMNVCTHSYSLVWYDKQDWEQYIDWLSLTGVNNIVALTGQEQIFYETFLALGLNDKDIRSWFNGPAFLTWSRGQNEYGSNIAGPLPKSWMADQFFMQRDFILPRLRDLGIIGQLPGFQGNVPIQMRDIFDDQNITQEGATGWMDALDPIFGQIADNYMQILLDAFGTDHWYQLDGYFNGGTAPWMKKDPHNNIEYYHDHGYHDYDESTKLSHNEDWFRRGTKAFESLNRTDPKAIWSFQGFAFIGWNSPDQAEAVKGFVDAVPKDRFVILDMSYSGLGEWTKFNNASFFEAPFVWTALHNFGGTDGIKGDIRRLNHFPHEFLSSTSIAGIGGTPEGINQNPAFYEFLFESTFRDGPVEDLGDYLAQRNMKRYGLAGVTGDDDNVFIIKYHLSQTWKLLMRSLYSNDFSTQDFTGIAHLNPGRNNLFEDDRYTPKGLLCDTFLAWEHMIQAIQKASLEAIDIYTILKNNNEPFRYDLVNLGREVLAQLSTPAAKNFTDATSQVGPNEIIKSGSFYMKLLQDVDDLVGTDQGFLLGPWLESARKWGANETDDCYTEILGLSNCANFYEFNARSQITTWNPTPKDSKSIPGGPIDYAAKHWNGLIKDYYIRRAADLLGRAIEDKTAGRPLNQTAVDELFASHAYHWTTSTNKYPTTVQGDAFETSIKMYEKYRHWFSTCADRTESKIA
ncbi:unnamed protein product [Cylindrotheca closterium]|uniref:Alpha-N-acetylglucosaminidase n=1 Tax=Cylindrotheca closterium TaxID=2856 RepID=A0AAD2FQG9_9STRA|nr:unnamed protein product [Cylindrotheca closterium]